MNTLAFDFDFEKAPYDFLEVDAQKTTVITDAPQSKTVVLDATGHETFRALDPSKPGDSPIVVVQSATIEAQGHLILFHIEASHFLWKMVRRVVGTLVKIGTGEISEQQFRALLSGKCEPKLDVASWTAPSSGLFLESITYTHTEDSSESHKGSDHRRRGGAARSSAANPD